MADIYANTVTPDMLQPSNGTLGAPPASVDGGLVVALRSPNISGEQFLDELNASRRVYQEPSVVTMVRNSLPDPRKSDLPSPGSSVNADAVPSPAKGWGAIPRSWRTAAMVGVPVAIGGYLLAQQQERARQEEETYLRNMMMEGMPFPY